MLQALVDQCDTGKKQDLRRGVRPLALHPLTRPGVVRELLWPGLLAAHGSTHGDMRMCAHALCLSLSAFTRDLGRTHARTHTRTHTRYICNYNTLHLQRSGLVNLSPTSTGSATAIAEVFPELKGKLNGLPEI